MYDKVYGDNKRKVWYNPASPCFLASTHLPGPWDNPNQGWPYVSTLSFSQLHATLPELVIQKGD